VLFNLFDDRLLLDFSSLMIACCWTFLLKRLSALSIDSPSSTTINAKNTHLLMAV